jgi:hypothetical protein
VRRRLIGAGFSAGGAVIALLFAFDLVCVSTEAGGTALLIAFSAAGRSLASAAIFAIAAGGEITAFFSSSGRGCVQQLEFSARSNALKLLISMASLVVRSHQMALLGVSARLKPQQQRRKV